jgi:hypothetical protein
MADLRNNETMVGPKNDSVMGPAGTRKRSRDSLYMLVGGSSDVYDVTVNFESANGHWCQKESGARCHGNGNGKSRTYGKPSERDKRNPQHWCKHVKAALADVEGLAEAEERTARAFGEATTATVIVKPARPAFEEKAEPVKGEPTARERLAVVEAEHARLREEVEAEETAEIRDAISALVKRFDWSRVNDAIENVA